MRTRHLETLSPTMDTPTLNHALLDGSDSLRRLLPHVVLLDNAELVFDIAFGLDELPRVPGIIVVRGARRYGKSTWLERQILATIETYGPGTAFYLNGDEIADARALRQAIEGLVPAYLLDAPVRRLFIDEITAIDEWEQALKVLVDRGTLRDVLVVTTGSRATDLRRGLERLPGRRGRIDRTVFLFTPVSYTEFVRVCGGRLGDDVLTAYLLSGGAPAACSAITELGRIPEYVIEMVRDWIYGEFARSGRNRSSIVAVMEQLHRLGGSPIGQAKLARESGLANNTVAAGYVELLADLMCVGFNRSWDASRRVAVRRRPAKFPFTNLLAALAWDPHRPRTVDDFNALPADRRAKWQEWAVAQELWRRAAIRGDEMPEELRFWRSKSNEIDYVITGAPDEYVEVKAGRASPLEFTWFPTVFPGHRLTVITTTPFETDRIRGITLGAFLGEG